MPKQVCRKEGCYQLVAEGGKYCAAHQRAENTATTSRRDQAHVSFYKSSRWRKVRAMACQRQPYCKCDECVSSAVMRESSDLVVDHIKEIKDLALGVNDPLAFDLSNLTVLCRSAHQKKTRELSKLRMLHDGSLEQWYEAHLNEGIVYEVYC